MALKKRMFKWTSPDTRFRVSGVTLDGQPVFSDCSMWHKERAYAFFLLATEGATQAARAAAWDGRLLRRDCNLALQFFLDLEDEDE